MIVELKIVANTVFKQVALEQLSLTQSQWDLLNAEEKRSTLQEYAEFHFDKAALKVTNWAEVKF